MPELRDDPQLLIEDVTQVHRMVSSLYVVVDAFDGGRVDRPVVIESLTELRLVVRKQL